MIKPCLACLGRCQAEKFKVSIINSDVEDMRLEVTFDTGDVASEQIGEIRKTYRTCFGDPVSAPCQLIGPACRRFS